MVGRCIGRLVLDAEAGKAVEGGGFEIEVGGTGAVVGAAVNGIRGGVFAPSRGCVNVLDASGPSTLANAGSEIWGESDKPLGCDERAMFDGAGEGDEGNRGGGARPSRASVAESTGDLLEYVDGPCQALFDVRGSGQVASACCGAAFGGPPRTAYTSES